MSAINKSKSSRKTQDAAPDAALASRDRVDVPTGKRRAGRRSGPVEEPTLSVEANKAAENRAILPLPGENPGSTPTRSETQSFQGPKAG